MFANANTGKSIGKSFIRQLTVDYFALSKNFVSFLSINKIFLCPKWGKSVKKSQFRSAFLFFDAQEKWQNPTVDSSFHWTSVNDCIDRSTVEMRHALTFKKYASLLLRVCSGTTDKGLVHKQMNSWIRLDWIVPEYTLNFALSNGCSDTT